MRSALILMAAVCVLAGCSHPQTAAEAEAPPAAPKVTPAGLKPGEPPDTILFPSKYGEVAFDHKKHFERVSSDCSVCHTKVFPQSLAPLNYKKALHRVAEADRSSCASCHAVGGSAFAADSNCIRCHAERNH